MRVFCLLLLSLIAFLFFASALLVGIPGQFSEKALWITVACPIIWLAFMFACYWYGSVKRVALILVAVTLISAAITFSTDTNALLEAAAADRS